MKKRLDAIAEQKQEQSVRREKTGWFLADHKRQEGVLTEFDEALWRETVESVTVHSEECVMFTFRDGNAVLVDIRED